jgi:hypothetical protein
MAEDTCDRRCKTELESAAIAAGLAWAASCTEQLRREGRRVAGGWPGTLSEARGRLTAHLVAQLGRGFVLANDEIESLAKATYNAARTDWLSKAGRDPTP